MCILIHGKIDVILREIVINTILYDVNNILAIGENLNRYKRTVKKETVEILLKYRYKQVSELI